VSTPSMTRFKRCWSSTQRYTATGSPMVAPIPVFPHNVFPCNCPRFIISQQICQEHACCARNQKVFYQWVFIIISLGAHFVHKTT